MILKLFSLLSVNLKYSLFILLILNLLVAFLEVISIGSIPVFLIYALDPNKFLNIIPSGAIKYQIEELFLNVNEVQILKYALIILIIIFLIKNLIILFNSIFQAFFNRKLDTLMSSKLFNQYLNKKYLFFLNNKPSELIKNIDSVEAIRSVITMFLQGLKEIIIIFGLLLLIGISNIAVASTLLLVGTIVFIFHKLKIAQILKKYGKQSYIYTENRYSLINEFFGSIVDIKILKKEKFFFKLFYKYVWSYETARIVDKITNAAVRPFVETTSILIMAFVIIFFINQGKSFSEIIPIATLLSLSFIRILPSAVLVVSYANKFKFESVQLKYLLENIFSDEDFEKRKLKITDINFEKKIELKNIYFKHLKSEKNILKNINFTINRGETTAIIGRTGSGKSTLINIISNLLNFDKGEIIFNDSKKFHPNDNFRINNLHYIRQDIYLLNDTIEKNVSFGEDVNEKSKEVIIDCLNKVGLNKFSNNINLVIGNKGSKLSGGENQLLGLARAIYKKPEIIFLDEPTSNLDYKSESNYFETIKKLNITSLIIAHRVQTLEYCDKIILLNGGEVIDQGNLSYFKKKYNDFTDYIN